MRTDPGPDGLFERPFDKGAEEFCFWLACTVDPEWYRVSRYGVPNLVSFPTRLRSGTAWLEVLEAGGADGERQMVGVCGLSGSEAETGLGTIEVVIRPDVGDAAALEARVFRRALDRASGRDGVRRAFTWRAAHAVPPQVPGWSLDRQAVFPEMAVGTDGFVDMAIFVFAADR